MNETVRDFWSKVKALLRGERARPAPIRPICYACREEIVGLGYRWNGRLFCDVYCVPPVQLYGDPR